MKQFDDVVELDISTAEGRAEIRRILKALKEDWFERTHASMPDYFQEWLKALLAALEAELVYTECLEKTIYRLNLSEHVFSILPQIALLIGAGFEDAKTTINTGEPPTESEVDARLKEIARKAVALAKEARGMIGAANAA